MACYTRGRRETLKQASRNSTPLHARDDALSYFLVNSIFKCGLQVTELISQPTGGSQPAV